MAKKLNKKKDVKADFKRVSNSNPRIEEIIKDYPQTLVAFPRGGFEDQLRKHLLKHKVQ